VFKPSSLLSHRNGLKKEKGSILVFTVAFIVVLLGFLGMAIYTGMNAYVQNELQNATSTAAMVGAAAMYDTNYGTISNNNPGSFPSKNTANAETAARAVFGKIVAQSPILAASRMNGRLDPAGAVTVNAGDDSIQVNSIATIPTPFLSLMGVDSFQITANARSGYVKNMFRNPIQLGGGSVRVATINLQHPMLDGPGPDLKITNAAGAPMRGYMVEACSGNSCVDLTSQAVTLNGGVVAQRDFMGQVRTVAYGNTIIDLEAAGVRKATSIRIIDDGIPDRYDTLPAPGQIVVESEAAPGSNIAGVEIFHHSTLCPAGSTIPCQNSQLQTRNFFSMTSAP
jgi:hypothetical protein